MALNLATMEAPNLAVNPRAEGKARAVARLRRPARILVVDDEAHVRSMIGATLERQGYDVLTSRPVISRRRKVLLLARAALGNLL